jgi:hypothetical protein
LAFQKKKKKSKKSKANQTLHSTTQLQKERIERKITRLNQKGELDFTFSQ